MATLNKSWLVLAFTTMILGAALSNELVARDKSCDDNLKDLMNKCKKYVQWFGSDPNDASPACCAAVRKASAKCVCDHVTKEVELAIDMKKAVAVAAKCGRPIPPGTQCGCMHAYIWLLGSFFCISVFA